jgi:hypothetical protein
VLHAGILAAPIKGKDETHPEGSYFRRAVALAFAPLPKALPSVIGRSEYVVTCEPDDYTNCQG